MWSRDLDEFEQGLDNFAKRKHEALEKSVKSRVKPPKRKHKNEILAEKRASNKEVSFFFFFTLKVDLSPSLVTRMHIFM